MQGVLAKLLAKVGQSMQPVQVLLAQEELANNLDLWGWQLAIEQHKYRREQHEQRTSLNEENREKKGKTKNRCHKKMARTRARMQARTHQLCELLLTRVRPKTVQEEHLQRQDRTLVRVRFLLGNLDVRGQIGPRVEHNAATQDGIFVRNLSKVERTGLLYQRENVCRQYSIVSIKENSKQNPKSGRDTANYKQQYTTTIYVQAGNIRKLTYWNDVVPLFGQKN